MATAADLYRIYFKPKLKGRVVARKRTVNRKSENVLKINAQLVDLAGKADHPVKKAREECIREGRYVEKIVYRGGKKFKDKVVDWDCFVSKLRKYMKETIKEVVPMSSA